MDPVLTMPEGRGDFGLGSSGLHLWTFSVCFGTRISRGELRFEVFSWVRWPARGGGDNLVLTGCKV